MSAEGCTCLDASTCDGKCTAPFDSLPNEKSDSALLDDYLEALALVERPLKRRRRGVADVAAFRTAQLDLDLSVAA